MKKIKFENLMAVCVLAVMLILFGAFLFGADILVVAGVIMAGAAVSLLAFVAGRKLVAKYPGMGKSVRRLASTAAVLCVAVAFLAVTAYAGTDDVTINLNGATFKLTISPAQSDNASEMYPGVDNPTVNGGTATVRATFPKASCDDEGQQQYKYKIELQNLTTFPTDGAPRGISVDWSFTDNGTAYSGTASWGADDKTSIRLGGDVLSNKGTGDAKAFDIVFSNVVLANSENTITWAAPYGNGSYTVNGAERPASSTVMSGSTVTLNATPAEGYELYCWLSEYTGIISGSTGKASLTYTVNGNDKVWPLFRATSTVSSTGEVLGAPALFMVKETKQIYTALDTALNEADSGQTVVLLASGVLTDSSGKTDCKITIPSGKKLLLPYDNRNVFRSVPKEYTLDQMSINRNTFAPAPSNSQGSIITVPEEQSGAHPTTEYCRLTMAGGAELIVEGEMEVSGQTQSLAKGHCGNYAQLQMQSGSKVTVRDKGVLYVYGFVRGSGRVEALSGSTVYEPFSIDDYPGGGVADMDTMNNQNVLAFKRFNIRNVEVPMTFHAGAKERIYFYTTGYSVGNNGVLQTFVGNGNDAILNLSSGTYTKSWENGRQKNIIDGQLTFNPFKITLKFDVWIIVTITLFKYEVDTAKTGMSLPDTWDITVNSGKLKLDVDFKTHAGATVTVNEGAELEIVSGKDMYLFDAADDPTDVAADARLNVNGTVTVNGALYVTKNGAQIISSEGTGQVVVNNFGTTPTVSIKLTDKEPGHYELQPALLQNGDGSYLPITVDTFTYSNDLDRWFASNCTVDDWNVTVAPTCTTVGSRTGNCILCGTIVTEEMPATGHNAPSATCEEASACLNCGQVMEEATGHDIEHQDCPDMSVCKNSCGYVVANPENKHVPGEAEATCTTNQICTECSGVVVYAFGHTDEDKNHVCDVCGSGTSCADADLDHICDFGGERISSCADAGKDHVCDYAGCKAAVAMDQHVDTNHDHACDYGCVDMIGLHLDENNDHGCEYDGCTTSIGYCIDQDRDHFCDYGCGKVTGTCEDADHDHNCDYGCSKDYGNCADTTKDHKCDYCDNVLTGCVDNLSKTEQIAATCTETGIKAYWTCDICGNHYSDAQAENRIEDLQSWKTAKDQGLIPALGHTEGETVVENNVDPDCVTEGSYENVVYCSVCDAEVSRDKVTVDALGHTEVTDEAVEATCTETGLTEGKHCSVCEEVLVAQEVVDALGHKWVDADCDTPKTCSVCQETEGEALGHSWTDADCDTPKTCSVCQETEGEALGHKWVDADCDTPKTCSVCKATEGEALGHKWVDADCDTPKTCSVCQETEGEALGHKWVDADCDTPKTCSVCQETEGEALGHEWTDATCSAPRTCTRCDTTQGDVSSEAHDWMIAKEDDKEKDKIAFEVEDGTYTVTVTGKCGICGTEKPFTKSTTEGSTDPAPTCTEPGGITYTVTFEESWISKDYPTFSNTYAVASLGHAYKEVTEQAATCVDPGVSAHYACENCEKLFTKDGDTYTETTRENLTIAPSGEHDWKDGVCEVCKTVCGHTMVDGVCTNCGLAETREAIIIPQVTTNSLLLKGMVSVNTYVGFLDENGNNVDLDAVNAYGGVEFTLEGGIPVEVITFEDGGIYAGIHEYKFASPGIPAKDMDKSFVIRPFVVIDGEKTYGESRTYGVLTYAENQLKKANGEPNSKTENLKKTLVGLLNYGAAAQVYFNNQNGYVTPTVLMNACLETFVLNGTLNPEYLNLGWDAGMLTPLVEATAEMEVNFKQTGVAICSAKSLLLKGAISVNYYVSVGNDMSNFTNSKVTMYQWSGSDYNKILSSGGSLTRENATYVITEHTAFKDDGYGYECQIASNQIPAKEFGDTVYVAIVVVDNDGTEHCTGIVEYSPEFYASKNYNNSSKPALASLVKWMVVYGERAETYFAS